MLIYFTLRLNLVQDLLVVLKDLQIGHDWISLISHSEVQKTSVKFYLESREKTSLEIANQIGFIAVLY